MSGVYGVVDSVGRMPIAPLLAAMGSAMSHREWYVVETYLDEASRVGLGRIGIGVFNKMPQPVWNASRTVVLVMAGELYNRDEFTKDSEATDEQIALALYEELGEDFVSRLNGVFIVALWDRARNRLLIANDHFGMYPLFYSCRAGRLIFAPEMKGILCDEWFPRRLDLTALAQYMRFQQVLGTRAFLEEIALLPGGSLLVYDLSAASCSVRPYWTFDDIPHRPEVSFEEAVEETGRLLRRAVKRLSEDACRPGVYLSGGLDSRTILGLVDRRPVVSLTYGPRDCRDVYYAERIAKAVGSDHRWYDLPTGEWVKGHVGFHLELTEGYHSWIHAHGINTLPQARQLIDANLSGWDGGTIMGDYDTGEPLLVSAVDDAALLAELFSRFNREYTWPSITEAEENLLYCPSFRRQVQGLAFESFRDELSRCLDHRADARAMRFYILNHCLRLTQNMVTVQRSHIEVRFPFFDCDLFEWLYSLPPSLRGDKVLFRAVIQREIPRLARIPYDHDEFLPTSQPWIRGAHALTVKLKRRINRHVRLLFPERHTLYADYERYLREELREWAYDILFDRRTLDRGIFDPEFIASIWKRHQSGQEEWTIGKIAPIMTYEMMLRRYVD